MKHQNLSDVMRRASKRSRVIYFVYLIPITLFLGTNIPVLSVGERTIYLGTNEIVLTVLTVCLIIHLAKRFTVNNLPKSVFISIMTFSCAIVVSSMINVFFSQDAFPITSIIEIIRWYEYLIVLLSAIVFIREEQQISVLLKIILLCLIVNIGVSLYQLSTLDFGAQRIYGAFLSGADRDASSISNPNVLGALFMAATLYFLSFALSEQYTHRHSFMLLSTLTFVAMIFTLSRSAFLGFIIGASFLAYYHRKRLRIIILSGFVFIGLMVLVAFYSDSVYTRMVESFKFGSDSVTFMSGVVRMELTYETLMKVPDNLWFGVGFGDFEKHFGFLTPDNYYVELLATTGIVGIVSMFIMLFTIIRYISTATRYFDEFGSAFQAAYISSFIAFLVACYFSGLFTNPRLLGLFWLMCAIMIRLKQINRAIDRTANFSKQGSVLNRVKQQASVHDC